MKDDPRQVAFEHMERAVAAKGGRRVPITVVEHADGLLYVQDGNATVQVLMLAQWDNVPVIVVPA